VNFQNAIKSGFKNYATFNGRSSRSAYWYWVLFTVVLSVVLSSINSNLANLGTLVTFIPTLAVDGCTTRVVAAGGCWCLSLA